jgi:hypothetical protein
MVGLLILNHGHLPDNHLPGKSLGSGGIQASTTSRLGSMIFRMAPEIFVVHVKLNILFVFTCNIDIYTFLGSESIFD